MTMNKGDGDFWQGCDIDSLVRAAHKKGVFSGLATSQQSPTAMAVNVASGVVVNQDTNASINVTSAAVTVAAASASGTRYDLVYIDSANAIAYSSAGSVSSTTPTVPDLPATALCPIAVIKVPSSATVINNSQIRDIIINVPEPVTGTYGAKWRLQYLGSASGTFSATANANVATYSVAAGTFASNDNIYIRSIVDNVAAGNAGGVFNNILASNASVTNAQWTNTNDDGGLAGSRVIIHGYQYASDGSGYGIAYDRTFSNGGLGYIRQMSGTTMGTSWITGAFNILVHAANVNSAVANSKIRIDVWREIGSTTP